MRAFAALLCHELMSAAAEQALAADGAKRPRDHGFFESWNQLDSHLDLSVRRS